MHKNSPGIKRVACRDDGIPIRRLRPHTYTHTQRNSISRLRIHALAWGGKRGGKSVWYRGDAAIEEKNVFHSYYAAYSSQSTGLPPRAPKSFSLLQKPPPPPECTTAGEYTRFAPPEWQPLFRYSPLDLQFRPSIHEIPAFPRNPALFLAIRLAIHRLAPFPRPFRVFASSCTPPGVRVHGCLPPFLRGFEAF